MSLQGSVVAVAHGIGPVIGGALASHSSDSWYIPNLIQNRERTLTSFKEVDLPTEPLFEWSNDSLRLLLYATEESYW
jgi:hypothetical protein